MAGEFPLSSVSPSDYRPANAIMELDERFRAPVEAADFPQTRLRYRNQRWAERVGLHALGDDKWGAHFGGFEPLEGTLEQPQALAYHGDQFGVYNPDIGDGRGFLFAQMYDDAGRLLDLGTKGSGQTPWSRTGDGRLTLKGGVREVLAANMLEALGVYTSKPFSLIETGEQLHRGDEPSPTRSSVLVRLSHSHIRFGTFQRLAYLGEKEALAELVDYCARHYHPHVAGADVGATAAALFGEIVERTADLAASWMAAGFVHGVLNTDNMVVTGESFDYGPWRFLPEYEPDFTAAYFDEGGRYRFRQQPVASGWNLARLGSALTTIADVSALQRQLERFEDRYEAAFRTAMLRMLGVASRGEAADHEFVTAWLDWLLKSKAPWRQAFHDWFCGEASDQRALASPISELYAGADFAPVRDLLFQHPPERPDRLEAAHFAQETPVSLVIDEVEAIWKAIDVDDDWSGFETTLNRIEESRIALGF